MSLPSLHASPRLAGIFRLATVVVSFLGLAACLPGEDSAHGPDPAVDSPGLEVAQPELGGAEAPAELTGAAAVRVDRQDPFSVARAFLTSYRSKDLQQFAAVKGGELAQRLDGLPASEVARIKTETFDPASWEMKTVQTWDGILVDARTGRGRVRIKYGEAEDGKTAVVTLRQRDGAWFAFGLHAMPASIWPKWGERFTSVDAWKRRVVQQRGECNDGNAASCYQLALAYRYGMGVLDDIDMTVDLLNKACDGGWSTGCVSLGSLYRSGRHVPKDETRAARMFKQGCELRDAGACALVAGLYREGIGVAKDNKQRAAYLEKACLAGGALDCMNVGSLYERGDGVRRSQAKADAFFERGCRGGLEVPRCKQ